LGEEKKKGRFIFVTLDEPEQPQRKITFFTDTTSGSIVEGSSNLSNVYLPPEQYEELRKTLDLGRGKNLDGTLLERSIGSGERTVRLSVTQGKGNIKIFVSYVQEDLDEAYQIYRRLRQEGYDPWIDKEKLFGGQDWDLEITIYLIPVRLENCQVPPKTES
jgi:hypothetical protein